jgi:hypothetical protein
MYRKRLDAPDGCAGSAVGGVSAVWIRSLPGAPGLVTVRASHPSLGTAVARVRVGMAG